MGGGRTAPPLSQEAIVIRELFARLAFKRLWILLLLAVILLVSLRGCAKKSNDIIGHWEGINNEMMYVLFRKDGTFKVRTMLDSKEGWYRVLSDHTIEISGDTKDGKEVDRTEYRLSGDTLEFKEGSKWIAFTRVK
jgi:hypothetical protein